ncbi:MAG: autotransporter outer membrane beta-barrel domain-containing protein, partial [Luteibacter sp.]
MNLLRKEWPARTRLAAAVGLSLMLSTGGVIAGTVTGPGNSATVDAQSPLEGWTVTNGGRLFVTEGGTIQRAFIDSGGMLTMTGATATALTSRIQSAVEVHAGATALITRSRLINTGQGRGFSLNDAPAQATLIETHVTGVIDGSLVAGGGTLTLDQQSQSEGVSATASGVRVSTGTVNLLGGSLATGQSNGIIVASDVRASQTDYGRHVLIDNATASGIDGSAISVQSLGGRPTDVTIALNRGAQLIGGNGVAIEVQATNSAFATISNSAIVGDMVATGGGVLDVDLVDAGASVSGRMTAVRALTQAAGATWHVAGDSDVASYTTNGGTMGFLPTGDATHHTTTVHGDFGGTGGVIAMNSELNQGGALANQASDRLLIEGNVTTSGATEIVVTPTGAGALTDANRNGAVDANEGLSLVQVAGNSRADAFVLRGGYVAAGPWQYTLHAFGPGEVDAAQNALATGALNWDYRLGNRFVCEGGNECVEPERPDPEGPEPPVDPTVPPVDPGVPPVDPGVPPVGPGEEGRESVVPQVPSYLSAPAALLTYGDMMNDGLHQRLGDIRQGDSHDPVGGEVFARVLGGQLRYTSNLSFERYGYDFDQQVNAIQLGGSLIALDGDYGTLRAGWALDHGTTRVTPKAADGSSAAKYRASGTAAWVTWQDGNGLWVDGVLGATRYRGDIGTDLRGADVARLRAHGWTVSVEAGLPIAIGDAWTVEPLLQVKHQSLTFRDFVDADDLDVRLGTARQTTTRIGAQVSRSVDPVFTPYARVDLSHTNNGQVAADVSSDAWDIASRFASGRVGNTYRAALGATSQLGRHVQLYGEGYYQHFMGGYGMRGWA